MKKTKYILIALSALFLIIGGMGCEKEKLINYIDINVVYERCNNSKDYPIDGEIKKNDILLFNLNQIKESEIIKLFSKNEAIEYIFYDPNPTSKSITYRKTSIDGVGGGFGNFCNFPTDILEKRDIPKTGLYISFSGDVTVTKFTTDAIFSTFDISLKSLKIRQP